MPTHYDELLGAETFEFGEDGSVNPRTPPDPRFDPANDAENAAAHGGQFVEDDGPDADDVQDTVERMLDEAINHYDENLEPDQEKATDYYWARPFGDEKEGRSKVVSADVRDATLTQMPSLMRVFFGPERTIEFRPRGPEDKPLAEQITDYVRLIITEDNPGFLTFHDWFQDALVRRLGVVKWWWEEDQEVVGSAFSGLSQDQVLMLMNDESVVDVEITGRYAGPLTPQAEMMGIAGQPQEFYDVQVTRLRGDDRARIAAVPNEEFVVTPNARSLDTAAIVAHVRELPADEVVALGVDPDLVEDAKGDVLDKIRQGDLAASRNYNEDASYWWDHERDRARDESQIPVLYAEAYARVDVDGDGRAERRLFQCVGPSYRIANGDGLGEPVDEVPFADLTPYRMAHELVGMSNYDLLKDVQRVKSQLERGMLDSLAQTIDPRTEVVQGEVNMSDILNPEATSVIRVRRPGMLREINHRFVGPDVLPVIDYQDQKRENATGTTKASAGLDPDALQSSTKAAVAATVSGSQQRLEMIARTFAETGVRRLFKGLLRLVVRHQDRARMVRLRGEWVEVDPRHWDASMDVSIHVALGQGTPEERLQAIAQILGVQQQLMQAGSPLVSNVELRRTLGRAVEMAGLPHAEEFFRPWTEQDEQQLQPPPPDPNLLLVQIEKEKNQLQHQMDQAKLEMEKYKAQLEDDRKRDEAARKFALEEYKIESEFSTKIRDQELKKKVEEDRIAMQRNESTGAS